MSERVCERLGNNYPIMNDIYKMTPEELALELRSALLRVREIRRLKKLRSIPNRPTDHADYTKVPSRQSSYAPNRLA